MKGLKDWTEIFRGGKQTDSNGKEYDGDALIDKAVSLFNPARHEPPAVIGHPKSDAPAYAWVEGLKSDMRDGVKVMFAKFKQVVPEFEEGVKKGLWKKRSAAFYLDGSLRHVGFLGAAPPAVKGLADIKFQGDAGMSFEFYDPGMSTIAMIFRNIRDWLIETEGKDTADKIIPDWDVDFIRRQADEETGIEPAPAFADADDKKAQKARAKKYGIAIKEGGHITKPGEWSDVPDEQFLDPVNYRYPCPNADQTRAAAAYWGKEKNQAQYSKEERSLINERLEKFRKKFKIGQEDKDMNEFKEKVKKFLSFIGVDVTKVPDDAIPAGLPADPGARTFTEADIEAARREGETKGKTAAQTEFQETSRKEARKQEIATFIDQGIKAGEILPAWKDSGMAAFMEGLADSEIQFTEQTKQSPYLWFTEFVKSIGKTDLFKEIASKQRASTGNDKTDEELGKSIASRVNR